LESWHINWDASQALYKVFFIIFAILIPAILTKIFIEVQQRKRLKASFLLESCAHRAWLEWCQWIEVMSKFMGVQRKISKLRDSGSSTLLALQLTDWQGLIIRSQMFSTHFRVPLSDNFHFSRSPYLWRSCRNLWYFGNCWGPIGKIRQMGFSWHQTGYLGAGLCTLCSTNYLQKACLSVNTVLQVMKNISMKKTGFWFLLNTNSLASTTF